MKILLFLIYFVKATTSVKPVDDILKTETINAKKNFSFEKIGFVPRNYKAIEVLQYYTYILMVLSSCKLAINMISIEYSSSLNINEKFIISAVCSNFLLNMMFFFNIELYRNIFFINNIIVMFIIILISNSTHIKMHKTTFVIIGNSLITIISFMILFIQTKKKLIEIPIDKLVKEIEDLSKEKSITLELTL